MLDRLLSRMLVVSAAMFACGPAHTAEAPQPEAHDAEAPEPVAAPTEATPPAEPAPPSTASYDEAMAKPESLDAQDTRAQLDDRQLSAPMASVMSKCSIPKKAKATVRVAVQNGHAIGVTVTVAFDKPKNAKPASKATLTAENKAKQKIVTCVDQAVRALTWPPSPRRDSFVTQF